MWVNVGCWSQIYFNFGLTRESLTYCGKQKPGWFGHALLGNFVSLESTNETFDDRQTSFPSCTVSSQKCESDYPFALRKGDKIGISGSGVWESSKRLLWRGVKVTNEVVHPKFGVVPEINFRMSILVTEVEGPIKIVKSV